MTDPQPERDERAYVDEKVEEKRDEKSEDEKDEKSWEEKWGRDMLSTATFAGVLIWIGVVLLGRNLGWADQFAWWKTWAVIISGVGAILLLEAFARAVSSGRRRAVGGNVILGLVFVGVGLQAMLDVTLVWPILLIGAGVIIFLQGAVRRRGRSF